MDKNTKQLLWTLGSSLLGIFLLCYGALNDDAIVFTTGAYFSLRAHIYDLECKIKEENW